MSIGIKNLEVSSAQLANYARLIYKIAGIRLSDQKKALLGNRLRRRLRATSIKNFDAYYRHLKNLDANDPEWDLFLQEITTHETYLYRDESHWNWFQKEFLPEITTAARLGKRAKRLRIWSAACSTGDESYTIASCIAASMPNYQSWNISIIGTDIGVGALQQAQKATFGERSMKLVPENVKSRFFKKAPDENVWAAKPNLTGLTRFKQHNLLDPMAKENFDLVFLKNVLIYFDRDSKAVVIKNIYKALAKGGLLLAGAAEGVSDLTKDFERVQTWLYRKPSKKRSRE